MRHVVQYSTGAGSAEVAARVVKDHGVGAVTLMTADTLVEDADNWRFAFEVWEWLGRPEWVYLADGRTPMQAGRDARCVPNNRWAVCSRVLKRELLRGFIDNEYKPEDTVICEGYDWTEDSRFNAAVPHWVPFTLAAPMMDAPWLTKYQVLDGWRDRGIEPPRLYELKGAHSNCGGACVRGGQAQWSRLLHWKRERFLEWECEEEQTRAMLGKDVAILKDRTAGVSVPLPLRKFRERLEANPSLFDVEDEGACGCTLPTDPIDTHTHTPSIVARIGTPGAPTLEDLAVNW